ncbi:MAG: hypothetical protein AAB414_04760 [Patescibacteria group bacterium]|mgnify:CR=1 FL=1
MANSANVIGQFKDEVEEVSEEVAEDVKDSVGEMIEQGVQSVAAPTLTPQQIQQKQLEEQKKLAQARKTLKWYQDIAAAQKKISEEEKQKKLQSQQVEEQEKQKKRMEEEEKKKIITSPAKKTPQFPGQAPIREDIALSRPELKGGHGKGG